MYKAILFAPDGGWVTDYRGCRTKEEVWNYIDNQGSRWYFYPFPAVITDNRSYTTSSQRIVDVCERLEFLKGHTIRTMSKYFESLTQEELEGMY